MGNSNNYRTQLVEKKNNRTQLSEGIKSHLSNMTVIQFVIPSAIGIPSLPTVLSFVIVSCHVYII